MIQSFKDKATRAFYEGKRVPAFQAFRAAAERKLTMLEQATSLEDLRTPPGNRLEVLQGNRAGMHSIRITKQWRLCFVWRDGHAHDVEIIDYHR